MAWLLLVTADTLLGSQAASGGHGHSSERGCVLGRVLLLATRWRLEGADRREGAILATLSEN